MAGLQAAQTRLDAAVTRLEKAYETYSARRAQAPAGAAPGPDIESLVRSLEATQQENTELTDLADTIGERLDRTIERLQSVIGAVAAAKSASGETGGTNGEPESGGSADTGA